MKKIGLIGGILGAFALVGGSAYGLQYWKDARPTKENFEKASRKIWNANSGRDGGRIFTSPRSDLCINLPLDMPPDAKSKSRQEMTWHIDYFEEAPPSPVRDKQLAKLNALTKAKLLSKSAEIVATPTGPRAASRYVLSDIGWATTSYDYLSTGTCFVYAHSKYLGVSSFEVLDVPAANAQGELIYKVHSKVGVSSAADLLPWAQDPEVISLFPQIQETVTGREYITLLSRSNGEWVNYDDIYKERANPERQKLMVPLPPRKQIDREFAEMRKLPAPTRNELVSILQKSHGHGKVGVWPGTCVALPGSEKLPVDQSLSGAPSTPYRVALSNNKERTPYDLVTGKTLPYVKLLEQLGVLVKVPNGTPGTYLDSDFYDIAPKYADQLDSQQKNCLALGAPVVEVLDLQVYDANAQGMPETSFQYKIKLNYPNHPKWMDDPLLLAQWTELKGSVERGMVCIGSSGFDRKTRETLGGTGTCWLAFDTITNRP